VGIVRKHDRSPSTHPKSIQTFAVSLYVGPSALKANSKVEMVGMYTLTLPALPLLLFSPLPLPFSSPIKKNCHPERSNSRPVRVTQSKDLRLHLSLPVATFRAIHFSFTKFPAKTLVKPLQPQKTHHLHTNK
jgi:hypothetical protein